LKFTKKIAEQLLLSTTQYPVDLDAAIEWWHPTTRNGTPERRDSIIRKLKNWFYEDINYHLHKNVEVVDRPQGGGSAPDRYSLTVECFKMMGMRIAGERGDQIRSYFMRCEEELKRRMGAERQKTPLQIMESQYAQEFEYYAQRVALREVLGHDQTPVMVEALFDWARDYDRSFSVRDLCNIYNEINKSIQSLTSKEIKDYNNLSKHSSIRDRFDLMTLDDYSAITRLVINAVRDNGMDPKKAVWKASAQWLGVNYVAKPVKLDEDIKKQGTRLNRVKSQLKSMKHKEALLQGLQLDLFDAVQAS
jgi:phage anti-repressor protein